MAKVMGCYSFGYIKLHKSPPCQQPHSRNSLCAFDELKAMLESPWRRTSRNDGPPLGTEDGLQGTSIKKLGLRSYQPKEMSSANNLSELRSVKQKQKQTKQTTRTGTEPQKWRSHGGLSVGEWEGERGGKGTENK